jgi:hypothetical protein
MTAEITKPTSHRRPKLPIDGPNNVKLARTPRAPQI